MSARIFMRSSSTSLAPIIRAALDRKAKIARGALQKEATWFWHRMAGKPKGTNRGPDSGALTSAAARLIPHSSTWKQEHVDVCRTTLAPDTRHIVAF